MRALTLLALIPLAACAVPKQDETRTLILKNCGACHVVPGVAGAVGRVGPSLDGIANQQIIAGRFPNSPRMMTQWLLHPQTLVPGNAMPEMGLTEPQAQAISDYLYARAR